MDDELLRLELELKALRPIQPSSDLQTRLTQTHARSRTVLPLLRWSWLAIPAAAALAVAYVTGTPREELPSATPETAPARTFKPVAAENLLLASRDEGYVTLTDGTTAHRTRQMYLDTITWKNPQTNASLTWSVPREEVRVVPVAYQ